MTPRPSVSRRFAGLLAALLLFASAGAIRATEPALPAAPAELAILQQKLADPGHPLVWVMTGDSITHGAKWLGHERSYPELIQERVRWSLKRRRDLFINSGISGERTTGLLADFEWRVLRFKPDIVSIMIGMNNAVLGPDGRQPFASDLRAMIRQVRAAGAIPMLHRTNPIDLETPRPANSDNASAVGRADVPAYNAIIAEVAAAMDVILVDHWTHWQTAKPTPAALRAWLADPIHPNGAGHRQFSIEFFRTIGCYDPTAPDCQP